MKEDKTIDDGKIFDGIEIKTTYIFPNNSGCITIKQDRGWLDEEDTIILIPLEQIEKLVKSLRLAKLAALKAK